MNPAGIRPFVEELRSPPEPWEAAQRLAGLPHLLLLESADRDRPNERNRYSFVSADPLRWWSGRVDAGDVLSPADMAAELAAHRREPLDGLPPFTGGLAGLFGYDWGRTLERLPSPRYDEFQTPDLGIGFYDWVIAFDHRQERAWYVNQDAGRNQTPGDHCESVKTLLAGVPNPTERKWMHIDPRVAVPLPGRPACQSNFTRGDFESAVATAVEYIHAGDCFQVNLSQRLMAPCADPLSLYGELRRVNPAPFAAFVDLGPYVVVSASPERFLRVNHSGRVESRPIKGTRPRSPDPAIDERNVAELRASEKDRAENVMIVDLLRNDLGKCCEYGSVRVTRLCEIESFATVHHLVSEVVGRLRHGQTALDQLMAAFPGGSVTGAPKVRAMEIIAELEPTARGPYCGSIGYLGFDGTMDTSILIRTFTVGGGWAQFPVGAGIVADSTPAAEYDETLAKAQGLLRALPS